MNDPSHGSQTDAANALSRSPALEGRPASARAGFLPGIGESDFRILRRQGLDIIDKSHLIIELLEDPSRTVLFPRPRRFGKTTNLTMLRYFFEKSDEDRADLFQDLAVWQDTRARAHFQAYPVIFLSLKDIKFSSWEQSLADLTRVFQRLLQEHEALRDSPTMSADERAHFQRMLEGRGEEAHYRNLLADLSFWLSRHHRSQAVILIDEYDTPLYAAWTHGYSDRMLEFMRALFGGALKDNPHLYKGVLTGILRVARESLFSGLKNLSIYSMLSPFYRTAFGFTEEEVADICARLEVPERLPDLRDMYNGYVADPGSDHPVAIYNPELMVRKGSVFHTVFLSWLSRVDTGGMLQRDLERALFEGDAEALELILNRILLTNLSYHDGVGREPEKLYHGLVMGLLVYLEGRFEVRSNPESGFGRVDVLIKPKKAGQPGVVLELKVLRPSETVATSLKRALDQVEQRGYVTQLEAAGATPILCYALLFDGKQTFVVTPESWRERFDGEPRQPKRRSRRNTP